ncbi:MAG: hypothetical protein OEN21_11885 [Myxococcales bacterium]|nr:hypothetical protein [Myxococcales bacterium]
MDRSKVYLVVVALVVVGLLAYKKLSSKSYEPIVFMGETYFHVEDNEVNRVENHMFTPGGVPVDETDEFMQISKYDHPDLTGQQVRLVQKQVISSFRLRALEGAPEQFFGVFEGTVPVYGYMKADAFVLKVGPKGQAADGDALRAGAGARIDALASVSTDL